MPPTPAFCPRIAVYWMKEMVGNNEYSGNSRRKAAYDKNAQFQCLCYKRKMKKQTIAYLASMSLVVFHCLQSTFASSSYQAYLVFGSIVAVIVNSDFYYPMGWSLIDSHCYEVGFYCPVAVVVAAAAACDAFVVDAFVASQHFEHRLDLRHLIADLDRLDQLVLRTVEKWIVFRARKLSIDVAMSTLNTLQRKRITFRERVL